tara:strand:- start:1533 stop:1781 length:249 start_codon:yes stop_codon:yes gene_type:complete
MVFKMKGSSFYGKSPFKKNGVDMSKLRSKQARMRKGISEFKHFADPNTQGDEPIVEYNMKYMDFENPKDREKVYKKTEVKRK